MSNLSPQLSPLATTEDLASLPPAFFDYFEIING
jgi:hypothetical protein